MLRLALRPPPPEITLSAEPVSDFAALGIAWTTLEAKARFSVFQGWGWVGCLAEERYGDALLVRAEAGGECIGLALLNRANGGLHLAESGDPARDRPFIEHNAPLVAATAPPGTAGAMLRHARRLPGGGRLRLSGVAPELATAAGGLAWRTQRRQAPYIDLGVVRATGCEWLAGLSANTRQQIRRSNKRLRAIGPLTIMPATEPAQADAWLDELMAMHDRRWGRAGAFGTPWLRRFHAALVMRCLGRGELDLLRVTAGQEVVGILYNLRRGGHCMAYQSGWVEAPGDAQRKPGLTCHHLAIELALARGDSVYDFLAGDQRYKLSLATDVASLDWLDVVAPWTLRGMVARASSWLGRR